MTDPSRIPRSMLCAICLQPLAIRDPLRPTGPRIPLLLRCGHSSCETCIRTAIKSSQSLQCGVCKQPSPLGQGDIAKDFPLNIFALGMFVLKRKGVLEDSRVQFVPAGMNMQMQHRNANRSRNLGIVPPNDRKVCPECMEKFVELECIKCDECYCKSCFEQIHKSSRSLSKHKPSMLGGAIYDKKIISLPKCDEHEEHALEFFCKEDNCFICSYCIVESHNGHAVVTLQEKNEEQLEELQEAFESGKETLKRLMYSRKKAQQVTPFNNDKVTAVSQEVVRYFVYLHGVLQIMERNILDRIQESEKQNSLNLEDINNDLNSSIQQLQGALQEAQVALNQKNLSKVNVSSIIEKLSNSEELPMHFVALDQENKKPDRIIRFEVNNEILKILESQCTIHLNMQPKFALVPTPQLPPEFEVDSIDDLSIDIGIVSPMSSRASSVSHLNEADAEAGTANSVSDSNSESVDRVPVAEEPAKRGKKYQTPANIDFVVGMNDSVIVSHIKNPGSFYVQRISDIRKLEEMSSSFKRNVTHMPEGSGIPDTVLRDGLYLVQYEADGNWYRGRVKSIREDSDKEIIEIFYIDYGNVELVSRHKLRCIHPRFVSSPAFALHCCLWGVSPRSGDEWSNDAIRAFAKCVNSNRVTMYIMQCEAEIYHVDLCKPPHEEIENDMPVSVRDVLVFLELASLVKDRKSLPLTQQKQKQFYQDLNFPQGTILDVLVSYVETPHCFYVQRLADHGKFLSALMYEMNECYRSAGEHWFVYAPEEGMPCAAQYSADGVFYRAKITGLAGDGRVRVFYVDYGNNEIVDWTRLRKLSDKHLRLAAQAIKCSLTDVVPATGKWNEETKKFFIETTKKKILRMYIDKASSSHLKVALYENLEDVDICINGLLVREGHAQSIGPSSSLVEYHKMDTDSYNKNVDDSNSRKKVVKMEKKNVGKSLQLSVEPRQNLDRYRLEVKVLKVISPSCVYIQVSQYEQQLESLEDEMQEFYNGTFLHNASWCAKSKCATKSPEDNFWCRGYIVNIIKEGKQAEVFLLDRAETVTVPIEDLRILDQKFQSTPDAAIRCHLSGIHAAGDKDDWPVLACEYLQEMVLQHESLYIKVKGTAEENSLPVELWYEEVSRGGALEPTIHEWKTINKMLVEKGVAIPVRGEDEPSTPTDLFLQRLEEHREKSIDHTESEWKQLASSKQVAKTERKRSWNAMVEDEETEKSAEDDDEEEEDEDTESPPCDSGMKENKTQDWLPAVPLTSTKFKAIPTYVDDEAGVYLHDLKEESTLKMIAKGLASRYKDSTPKPQDLYWFPGQICISQYHADKNWYRAKVLEVLPNNMVKVSFVDYGNVEMCKALELRKNVFMTSYPIQAHRCQIHEIVPNTENGTWEVKALDFIHSAVVDKECSIDVIVPAKDDSDPQISLVESSGLDIRKLLVELDYARYKHPHKDLFPVGTQEGEEEEEEEDDNADSVIVESEEITEVPVHAVPAKGEQEGQPSTEESKTEEREEELAASHDSVPELTDGESDEEESDGFLKYKIMKLLESQTLIVEVTAVLTPTEIVIHPLGHKHQCKEIKSVIEKFDVLTDVMQVEAPEQPVLTEAQADQPCCACYSEDGQWYRGIIVKLNEEEKTAKVYYVDYGNMEDVPLDRVHDVKEDWLSVPVQGLRCVLSGVTIPETCDKTQLNTLLPKCLFQPPLVACIKKIGDEKREVELRLKKSNELAYQLLLDEGLMEIHN